LKNHSKAIFTLAVSNSVPPLAMLL